MSEGHGLYHRWLSELWNGDPYSAASNLISEDFHGHWPDHEIHGPEELASAIAETQAMFTSIEFILEVGPFVEGDLVAGRWTGQGHTPDGVMNFFGNDILRFRDGRFVEYWTASATRP
ncbi:ester cyclase [Sciscionella marina]|uniref:ester cyclase n=1 Tax=Sciscionella marina TaxID=508770 RepID=UPI0003706784|nr:nuclear transport factor 2 family protein [Sciscionella marina]